MALATAITERQFYTRRYYFPQEIIPNYGDNNNKVSVRFTYAENEEIFKLSELKNHNCVLSHIGRYLKLDYEGNKYNENIDITVNRVNGFLTINNLSMYNVTPMQEEKKNRLNFLFKTNVFSENHYNILYDACVIIFFLNIV